MSTAVSRVHARQRVSTAASTAPAKSARRSLSASEIARRTGLGRVASDVAANLQRQVAPAAGPARPAVLATKGIASAARGDAPERTRSSWNPADLIERIKQHVAEQIANARAAQKGAGDFRRASPEERQAMLAEAREAYRRDPDPHSMDSVDLFRDRLTPQARLEYDRQLARLRDDPRVRVVNHDGSAADPATRELALRGMLAATFPNTERLDNAIQTAVDTKFEDDKVKPDGKGTFDVIVYPDSFDIADHTYPTAEGQAPGLKTQDGDLVISESFLDHTVVAGEHLMIHEFAHCLQHASSDGGVSTWRDYPEDFAYADQVNQAFDSDPAFRDYIRERFGVVHDGVERFPTLMNVFHTEPEALRAASPELYQMMVYYTGLDPIAGEITTSCPAV